MTPTRGTHCAATNCTRPVEPGHRTTPYCGQHRRRGPDWQPAAHQGRDPAAVVEDVEWILRWDASPDRDVIAARVGLSWDWIRKILAEAGRRDLVAKAVRNA